MCDACEETCIASYLYKMLYFEKRVKDGLPDPNGPLSACIPSDNTICRPTERYPEALGMSVDSAASEGKKRVPYIVNR